MSSMTDTRHNVFAFMMRQKFNNLVEVSSACASMAINIDAVLELVIDVVNVRLFYV